jgi:hypothetical protein
MNGVRSASRAGRLFLATILALVAIGASGSAPRPATAAIPRWTGAIDLYRRGVFTTQKTWLWCTAADVQIMRNIVDHAADHSRASQERYFTAMRAHDRYDIPLKDGVDPAGWAYGLRQFVDGRYRLVASGSFDAALRSAVTNLRKTNRPVGITVAHGDHAWVLTGFSATADPATTTHFTVTSVRVVGPLWGLQSTSYGYDMKPDTRLTPKQLAGFFTPWHYVAIRMAWEGDWVSIQPIAARTATVAPAPTPHSSPSPRPTTRPRESAATPAASSSAGAVPSGSPTPMPTPAEVAVAGGASPAATSGQDGTRRADGTTAANEDPIPVWIVAAIVVTLALVLVVARAAVRRRSGEARRTAEP